MLEINTKSVGVKRGSVFWSILGPKLGAKILLFGSWRVIFAASKRFLKARPFRRGFGSDFASPWGGENEFSCESGSNFKLFEQLQVGSDFECHVGAMLAPSWGQVGPQVALKWLDDRT